MASPAALTCQEKLNLMALYLRALVMHNADLRDHAESVQETRKLCDEARQRYQEHLGTHGCDWRDHTSGQVPSSHTPDIRHQ